MSVASWIVAQLIFGKFGDVSYAATAGIIQGTMICAAIYWAEPSRDTRLLRLNYWGPIIFYLPGTVWALYLIGLFISGGEEGNEGRILVGMAVGAVLGIVPAVMAYRKGRDPIRWWMYGSAVWIVALIHAMVLESSETVDERIDRA